MHTQAIKGRALASFAAALVLLVIVIFLIRAGRMPILLILLTALLAGDGIRILRRLRAPQI